MLDYIVEQTDRFVSSKPKDLRKSFGQFFTSKTTARYMAGMLTVPRKETISVIDPGAGSGILSAAVIEMIEKNHPDTNEVHLTCYETNSDIMPLLEANIEYMTRTAKVKLRITIINENYILEQSDDFSGTLMASQEHQ